MARPTVIGIAGKAGSGKDTLATYLATRLKLQTYSFAHPLKKALNAIFGFDMSQWDDRVWKERVIPEYGQSPRYLAQTIGTEWGRDLVHPDLWVLLAEKTRKAAVEQGWVRGLICPDARFENECTWIREHGVIIHIRRPTNEHSIPGGHVSESGVKVKDEDLHIWNVGTLDDLYRAADKLLKNLS